MTRTAAILAPPLAAALIAGCGAGPAAPEMPTFEDPRLAQGRSVWMQVCRNCHLLGVSGSPAVDDFAAWAEIRRKGRDVLYRHAIEGIPDPDGGWTMPPRGGHSILSDAQVAHALDYMLTAVQALEEDQAR
jgi:cytochrome c5